MTEARRRANPVLGAAAWRSRGFGPWLLARGPSTTAALVVIACLVKYGLGVYPSIPAQQALAEHWRDPLASPLLRGAASYHLRMPVSAVLAGWLHATSDRSFVALHLLLALAALAIPFLMPATRRSPTLRALVAVLMVGGAVPAVLLGWVGSFDAVTLGAVAVAGLADAPWVAALGWAVFAFNNAPTAALALVAAAAVLWSAANRAALPRLAWWAGGACIGYIGIRVLDAVWGGGRGELNMFAVYGYSRYLRGAEHGFFLIALSALGVGWFVFTRPACRALPPARMFVTVSILACAVVPFIALDESRVTASVLWAAELTAARSLARLPDAAMRSVLASAVPVAAVAVIVLAWDSHLVYGGPASAWQIVHFLLSGGPLPRTPSYAWVGAG